MIIKIKTFPESNPVSYSEIAIDVSGLTSVNVFDLR